MDPYGLVNVPPNCQNSPGGPTACSGGGTGTGSDDLVMYNFPGGHRPLMPMDLYGLDILLKKIQENNLNAQYNLPLPSSPSLPPVMPEEPAVQDLPSGVVPNIKNQSCEN